MGRLLARQDLLLITLALLISSAVLSLVHFAISREVLCPLCKGSLLRSQGCSYHSKARRLLGSCRLGVVIPALFSGRFRCPYCGESCSCSPRGKHGLPSRSRSSRLSKVGVVLLFLGLCQPKVSASVSVNIQFNILNYRAPSNTTPNLLHTPLVKAETLITEVGLNAADLAETPNSETRSSLPLFEVSPSAALPLSWQLTTGMGDPEKHSISPLTTSSLQNLTPIPEPRGYLLLLLGLVLALIQRNRLPRSPRSKSDQLRITHARPKATRL